MPVPGLACALKLFCEAHKSPIPIVWINGKEVSNEYEESLLSFRLRCVIKGLLELSRSKKLRGSKALSIFLRIDVG